MARTKKPNSKLPKTTKVKFVTGEATNDSQSLGTITEGLRKSMGTDHSERVKDQQNDILAKSVKPLTIRKDKKTDRNKIVYSTREVGSGYDGVEVKTWRRLSDSELKELAQVDPYISAIISTRCSQGAVCARPSDSKFDKGTRIAEIRPLKKDDFENEEEFEQQQKIHENQMKEILRWFQTCGTDKKDVIDSAFAGSDNVFKKCILPDFVTAQVRNLLTFGRAHLQKFRDEEGNIQFFRPAPTETIMNVVTGEDIFLGTGDNTEDQSAEDVAEYNQIEDKDARPYAFVQRIDGRNANFFTEQDMDVWYFQKQALFDLNGYPLSPIEQAIYMVFTHQQTLGYLRNQFVKGMGNKGILSLESTDAAAMLSDEDLDQLRREFHNFVSRNDNSAAMPVISGPVKVNYIPLSPNPRDMEFLQVEEHVIRALCSAMQISPEEMGYGHLSIGAGGLSQANKQQQITQGEERGLRMLLDIIYDGLNEILYENFPEARDTYRITYVGVGEDTRDSVVQRQQSELQTTATLSSLWADSEKTDPVPYGGDVPLAPAFHANVARYMKYGKFMEMFFGEKGWADKPEYDFIIDPNLNQAYLQLKAQPIKLQQEQAVMGLQQQQMQLQAMAQQEQAQDQQMGQTEQQGQMAQAQAQQPQEAQQQQPEAPTEEAEKSLKDEFLERQKLNKSMSFYFGEWLKAHENQS